MRIESIGIAAAELWLPPGRELATTAVAEGRLRAREAADLGHPEVPDAGAEAPPELAVAAATGALKQAGADPADLAVVCHAWMYYQGHDLWSPAHYVAAQLGARAEYPRPDELRVHGCDCVPPPPRARHQMSDEHVQAAVE